MLQEPDVLLLKLALERELLDATGYRNAIAAVRSAGAAGSVGRALRQLGVPAERVSELALTAAQASQDPKGQIPARCDLEDAIVARAIERSKLVAPEKLERAQNELKGLHRLGELPSLSEVLVKRRWLEVPVAVELRRRARERVASCPRCKRHYIVDPEKAKGGRFKCRDCQVALEPGGGTPSAVDVARGLPPEKPAAPIEASQMVALSPEKLAELQAARQAGMRAELERERAAQPAPARSRAPSPQPPGRGPTSEVSGTRMALPPSPSVLDFAAGGTATPDMRRLTSPLSGVPRTAAATPPPGPVDAGRAARADRETVSDVDDDAPARRAGSRREGAVEESASPKAASWDSVHDADEPEAPPPAAVATFGEYEILSEVARGGMGIVYKARRRGTTKVLALKVLISGVDATEEQVRRFEMEGEAARKIKHPGIVRIYDAGRHEGYHYIAMEYVEGQTLEAVLAKGALEPRRAARIIRDLARAVHQIHENAIVHRDLKPGNVILNEADAPKLIDFGLAKSIDRRAKLTRSGAAVGTPFYMPPEQVRGEAEKIGPPSDVYALGAIFFEMLSGEVPFKADNPIELYHKIASSELLLPEALREDVPDDLVTIVSRCMEKKPEDRYPSAAALADDLDRWLEGQPLAKAPRKAAAPSKGKKGAGSRLAKVLAVVGALALVAAIGASVVVVKLGSPQREARRLQEKGRRALLEKSPEHARVYFEDALKLAATDPSLEVDLARALAATEPAAALAALERADQKGLKDADALEAVELRALAQDPRFRAVQGRVRERH